MADVGVEGAGKVEIGTEHEPDQLVGAEGDPRPIHMLRATLATEASARMAWGRTPLPGSRPGFARGLRRGLGDFLEQPVGHVGADPGHVLQAFKRSMCLETWRPDGRSEFEGETVGRAFGQPDDEAWGKRRRVQIGSWLSLTNTSNRLAKASLSRVTRCMLPRNLS